MPEPDGVERAFIAIDMPDEAKESILSILEELPCKCLRPVKKESMHLTLIFLGRPARREVEDVRRIMGGLDSKKFAMSIKGIGAFTPREPRVVFVSINEGKQELLAIHRKIAADLGDSGIAVEDRPYQPHITIARVYKATPHESGQISGIVEKHKGDEFGSFVCGSIKLKSSIMEGGHYTHNDIYVKELDS